MSLSFLRTIARCPESSVEWPSTMERENGGVGFIHSCTASAGLSCETTKYGEKGMSCPFALLRFFGT